MGLPLTLSYEPGRIKGVVNVDLTPESVAQLGAVLGTILGEGTLVVMARDFYPPSRMLKRAFSSGLMSTGVTIMDFHGASLPELAFSIKRFGAKAGIHFTVSVAKEDTILIKLLDSLGTEMTIERTKEIIKLYETKHIVRTIPKRIGWISYAEYIHDIYTAAIIEMLDVDPIVSFEPKVVVDLNFSPASEVVPDLLSEIGVNAITLNSHKPPLRRGVRHLPSTEGLNGLSNIVKTSDAHLGVALCADASRIVLIDDKGAILTPDETIGLMMSFLPEGSKVVISDTVTEAVDSIAEKKRIKLLRVRGVTGDVARQARKVRATLAATDKGEFIYPSFSLSPDGILSLGRVVEHISLREKPLSELRKDIPKLEKYELKVNVGENSFTAILDYLSASFTQVMAVVTGVKIIEGKNWAYVEPDFKERTLKVSVEKPDKEKIELAKKVVEVVEGIISEISKS
ncbi:MAG TPA: hypothetical protein ENF80_00410 [Thermofilum sp.]|nr:hypothetical protein [Thermofilum sp.]